MRLSHPFVIALFISGLVGIAVLLLHPAYVMTAFAADFARINYQGGFPPSFQRYIDYRYSLAALFALATFGAVYVGLTVKTPERWVIGAAFLLPTLSNYLYVMAFFFFPVLILGLLIRIVLLYRRRNQVLFRPYCFCLLFNCLAIAPFYVHLHRVLDIIL